MSSPDTITFKKNDLVVIRVKSYRKQSFGYLFRVYTDNYEFPHSVTLHPLTHSIHLFKDDEYFSHTANHYQLVPPEVGLTDMPDEWLKETFLDVSYKTFIEQYLDGQTVD